MPLTRRRFLETVSGALVAAGVLGRRQGTDADPLGVRDDFPAATEGIYLDSAYITPSPVQVHDAGHAFLEAKTRRPIALGDMLRKTDEVRGQYARLINAGEDEVAFLYATSEGENIVSRALDLQEGDNVVVDALHYDGTFVNYRQLEAERGIELRIAQATDGAAPPEAFESLVDDRTRLVSVAWVSHQNGYRHDMRRLADLAHAHGAYLYTDGIQAVGMIRTDVAAEGIDFMAAGTYKWLLGGFGVAPFFIRRDLVDRIRPDRAGMLQAAETLEDHRFELHTSARKFEYATLAFAAIYQLNAGLGYLERIGIDTIEAHGVALADRVQTGLRDAGLRVATPPGNRTSIVAVHNEGDGEATARRLDEARVKVSLREGGRQIRVSPALFNTASDVDRFLEVATAAIMA